MYPSCCVSSEGSVLTNYTKTAISFILKHYFYFLDYKGVVQTAYVYAKCS